MTEELKCEQVTEEQVETEAPASESEEAEIKPKDAKKPLKAVRSELEKTKKD